MGSPSSREASVYDRIKSRLDAADLIRRLGLTVARTIGAEAYCAPLCHESQSGESLQINLHTGRWNCKACQESGYSGDLIQLVEYALSHGGVPTHGSAQGSSSTHRAAIEWLCEQFGIAYSQREAHEDPALEVVHLFAMRAHRHLLARPDILEWIREKWGFDTATIEAHGIGFVSSPIDPKLLKEAELPQSIKPFRSSGVGFYRKGSFVTRFEGRIIFPYLEAGRAVYLIGRATPQTPSLEDGRAAPKYHKLSVHSTDRLWVSDKITNDHLYNEPVLENTDRVIVAEGVADAVALSSLGAPVVSPVTISFNAADLERFCRKAEEAKIVRVEILFDNELSGSGGEGALRVGRKLIEKAGLNVVILTLPLGPDQERARREVLDALGEETFAEYERANPRRRKEILAERFGTDEGRRKWVLQNVAASKIDAAEWCAAQGAAAAGQLDLIRKGGRDVVELQAAEDARGMDPEGSPVDRLNAFVDSIQLAAHVDEGLLRGGYARAIALLAGKGITKSAVEQRISRARRTIVRPKRREEKEREAEEQRGEIPDLILPPPTAAHVQPSGPAPPPGAPGDAEAPSPSGSAAPPEGLSPAAEGAPAAPVAPAEKEETEHERFSAARSSVLASVEARRPEESVGEFVAQAITRSMGFTPFVTREDLFLVRGSERIAVGRHRRTPEFATLIYLVSGLTGQKGAHRSYIDVAVYFLRKLGRTVEDVSWSHVAKDGGVYFPTADAEGTLLRIDPGKITQTRMSERQVPAVAGPDFQPIRYESNSHGIDAAIKAFGWTSLAPPARMILTHWIVALPLLRRIGTVPIIRIEGGTSSGKTRAVDAVSFLVNGGKSSSVPTAAALISRMSTEMLTIDDNREVEGVSPAFLGTLLQATQLGAREKRRGNSDTGTVIERISGAILMNGVEPIHSGRSELASRMLVMRIDLANRAPGSPSANDVLFQHLLSIRDAFWSEALDRCAIALELDAEHGERIGAMIEQLFGLTRIGRLSAYIRVMYFTAIAALPAGSRAAALNEILPSWCDAFTSLGRYALASLVHEELAVSSIRYALDYAHGTAEAAYTNAPDRYACNGKYHYNEDAEDEILGPFGAPQLARLVRKAGKELNAPRTVTTDLRAGQLEARIVDGIGYLEAAGIHVKRETTRGGKLRFTFYRSRAALPLPTPEPGSADTLIEFE